MLEQNFNTYVFVLVVLMVFLVASLSIPFYGFFRKRWKGLIVGCLVQPVICVLAIMLVSFGISYNYRHDQERHRKAAMVAVKKPEKDSLVHYWYLNTNDECYYEYLDEKDPDPGLFNDDDLFDVIPLDSFSVGVDDKIVVRFDLKKHKVTATEYDEPIEVVSVDWDKVNEYFKAKKE